VGVLIIKMKVAVSVGVIEAVFVGKGVKEGVNVGGISAAVCVDAAPAV
jgi:hypothetical protein